MSDRIEEARAVLQRFLESNQRGDEEAMRSCLTRETLESGQFSGPMPGDMRFQMGPAEDTGESVIIPMRMGPAEADDDGLMEMRSVMVQEDGEWKFDLKATAEAQMAAMEEAMGAMAQQLGDAMGEAFESIGDALSEAFGGGEEEPNAISMWEDAPMVPSEEELRWLPEMTVLSKFTEEVSNAVGEHVSVEADMPGLLERFQIDDEGRLLTWLEESFFEGMAEAIGEAAGQLPVRGLLRNVRLEPVIEPMQRTLVLDGLDLVYRVDLREPGGWYDVKELRSILPGVLAGLDESAREWSQGRSTLPTAEHAPSLQAYQYGGAMRAMRQLCQRLGQPVALDVEWDGVYHNDHARSLPIWGVNRVVGAVTLAVQAMGEQPELGWLTAIRMQMGFEPGNRQAVQENGVLSLRLVPTHGEQGCFYEHELFDVLMGNPVYADVPLE